MLKNKDIFIIVGLLVSRIILRLLIIFLDLTLNLLENNLFKTISDIILYIPFVLIVIFIIYRLVQNSNRLKKMENLIAKKDYDTLNEYANKLFKDNPNSISIDIYCINLVFQKKYYDMLVFYDANKNRQMASGIYQVITKFIAYNNVEIAELNNAKTCCNLNFMFQIKPLLEKIILLKNKNYSAVLNIKSNKDIDKNEFFLFTFNLCELKAKKELNLDYSEEQKFLDNSYFKIDTPLN